MTDNRKRSGNQSSGARKTGTQGKRAYVANARDSAAARRAGRPVPTTNGRTSSGTRTGGSSGSGRGHSSSSAGRRSAPKDDGQLKLRFDDDDSLKDEITIILILLAGVLMVLSYLHICGSFGEIVNKVIFGLMGSFGYAFPFVMVFVAIFAIANKRNRSVVTKTLLFAGMMIFVSALVQLAAGGFNPAITIKQYFTNSVPGYLGDNKTYGGFFGGLICKLLCPYVGNAAAAVIMSVMVVIFFLLIVGKALFTAIARRGIETAEEFRARRREEEEYEAEERERRRAELEAARAMRDIDPDDGPTDVWVKGRKGKAVREDDIDIDDLDEFDEDGMPKSAKKKKLGTFIDSLLRSGMGLETERIADTPEYQKMKDAYGITSEAVEEITAQTGEADDGNDLPGETEPDDIVSKELSKKFSSNTGIDVVKLHDHPKITKTENTVVYMVDEEEEYDAGHTGTASAEEHGSVGAHSGGMNVYDIKKGFEGRGDAGKPEQTLNEAGTDDTAAQPVKDRPYTESKASQSKETSDGKTAVKAKTPNNGAASFNPSEQIVKHYEEQAKKPEPPYQFPPLSLLTKGQPTGKSPSNSARLKETVAKLQQTFESFGVGVTVTDATVGPTVTRYEMLPDQGVKVKTITSLADDIKLALAAAEIRIEAPIPGKAAVGIEVPNETTSPVLLRDLLDTSDFKEAKSKLTFAVGKDIGGKSICFDIGSMPHMLIAGATGSGKSVCINALILSILYKAKPSEVKMVMIDPKRVELIGYNGIPHLLVPVVTDVKKATGALNWAIAEMDDRYARFADTGVNNLKSYNQKKQEKYEKDGHNGDCPDKLPQILIIVDELNDLMMTANSKEVEGAICRLTQLARASGIHVVLATQRPSVNVITGTIKANIPSRIAFSVSSIVDSRTILDQSGAEKLLGKGDMLFYPQGYPKPVRLQGAFVSDKEIAEVVKYIKENNGNAHYNNQVSEHIEKNAATDTKGGQSSGGAGSSAAEQDDGHDEFFEQAGRLIIEKQKASIGMLQRVYKIGFNRAARIMDQLAEEGIVGPEEGTKPRRILMTLPEFDAYMTSSSQASAGSEDGGNDEQ